MSATPTRIVIVGGVAGGMSCAARARRLDASAEVVVLERGDDVSVATCGFPYHVGGEIPDEDDLLVQTPASLRASLALDVRTRHDVVDLDIAGRVVTAATPDGLVSLSYDALVLSPGARAVPLPLPGLDASGRAHTLRSVGDAAALRALIASGAESAVVLGGGFIGLEAAEALAGRGLAVTVVQLGSHVLAPLEAELASLVTDELARIGIDVRSGASAVAIEPGEHADTVVLDDGSRLTAGLVVVAAGVRPDTAVFEAAGIACERGAILVDEHGRTSAPGVWAVGDAVAAVDAVTGARRPVPLAGPAARAGRLVADDILRPETARPIPATLGTAIVRVGELTTAMTGANRSALAAAGIAHHTIHLHPTQHVGWFPGATQMHLLVHFRTGDGLLLGAQAVGRSGVDKRIDVLATAIRDGRHVDELIDLDLAYAPPYGAAKDPVNLAGMAGENVLLGTTRLWYADELDTVMASALVLDVRRPDEIATGHLPEALCIPHTELRDRLDEVRVAAAGRPVRVMCQSGVRSYIAHRVLVDAGLDSASLSGGMLTLRAALGSRIGGLLVTGVPTPLGVTEPTQPITV